MVVKITYKTIESGVQSTRPYDISNSTDIHAKLLKYNNSGTCIYEHEIEAKKNQEYNNYLLIEVNETLETGSYGLEVTGVDEFGKIWRFKLKPGELFQIVDSTSASSYEDGAYVNFDAEIGVIGINTPVGETKRYTDQQISALHEQVNEEAMSYANSALEQAITYTDTQISSVYNDINNINSYIGTLDDRLTDVEGALANHSSYIDTLQQDLEQLSHTVSSNETDIESKHSILDNQVQQINSRLSIAEQAITTNETDIEQKHTQLTNTVTQLTNTVNANETDIESKVAAINSRIDDVQSGAAPLDALDNYYTKAQTRAWVGEQLSDYYTASATNDLLNTTNEVISEALNEFNDTLDNFNTKVNNYRDATTAVSNGLNQVSGRLTEIENNYVDSSDLANYATTSDLQDAIDDLVGGAPAALDTLKELADQLQNDGSAISSITNTLATKANSADLATVATTGDYDDLNNKPTLPTKTSDLTNDSGFLTQHQDISGKANKADLATVATTGNYADLIGKPTIPTKTSQLTNDAGFLTQHQDISGKANSADLATVATSGSYNDLSDKPTIPTKTSDLTNDLYFVKGVDLQAEYPTRSQVNAQLSDVAETVAEAMTEFDSRLDVMEAKTIPTKTSDLTNDSGFLTQHQTLKTVNNQSLIGTGNITISGGASSYNDLTDKPTIPTKTSDLTNDSGFLTQHQDISGKANTADLATVATSGSYNDLVNKPTIPTKTSDLTNDTDYISSSNLATVATSGSYKDLTNKPTIPTVPGDNVPKNCTITATYAYVTSQSKYGAKIIIEVLNLRNNYINDTTYNEPIDINTSFNTSLSSYCSYYENKNVYLWVRYSNSNAQTSISDDTGWLKLKEQTSDFVVYLGELFFVGNANEFEILATYQSSSPTPVIPKKRIGYCHYINAHKFLTSHQKLKTINNESIVGSGNIDIDYTDEFEVVSEALGNLAERIDVGKKVKRPAVYYTQEQCNLYNQNLEGGILIGSELTAEQATAVNTALETTYSEGDTILDTDANNYNATLTGAKTTSDIYEEAKIVDKTVKEYVDENTANAVTSTTTGLKIEIVNALPATTDPNTLYIIK
jgi:predicted  nucleic acid-binding Zn-ribbon protein